MTIDADPLADAKRRGEMFRREILSRPDMLTVEQVAEMLGGMTREEVDAKRKNKQLLALEDNQYDYKYPACQIEDGRVIEGLAEILVTLKKMSPWLTYRFLKSPDPYLHDHEPIKVLKNGDIDRAIEAAERYASGDQGGN